MSNNQSGNREAESVAQRNTLLSTHSMTPISTLASKSETELTAGLCVISMSECLSLIEDPSHTSMSGQTH